ncbi:MAG TPA: XRE family transcriptional regulator [Rhodobacteraceae bacterium]|nr:XRE family transcriptional regulator [Paracoccaceae bacterium]
MNEQAPPQTQSQTLGADLRSLRKTRGLTLEGTARALDKSVGWLSQVERDISSPRMSDLRQIAELFGVPLSLFFGSHAGPAEEAGLIVRVDHRRTVGVYESGLVETLLSPDLTDDFEVIHSTFQPGSSRAHDTKRETQELAYMVAGKLDIWIDDQPFTVSEGDSFRIRGQSYRWSNPYKHPATAVWVISPPVY